MEAHAFCPGHITFFFAVHRHGDDAARNGSRGAGFCVESGVSARALAAGVPRARTPGEGLPFGLTVRDNGKVVEDPQTTRLSLEALLARAPDSARVASELSITNNYTLPIGAGFGVSGACALSATLSANGALGLGLPFEDCVAAAHIGEVRARSGLGDVVSQAVGGFEVRVREGAPPHGEVRRLPVTRVRVLLVSFGPLRTGAFLSDARRVAAANAAGVGSLERLLRAPSLEGAFGIGRQFAESLGLVSAPARRLLEGAAPDALGTVAMLGDSLAILDPPASVADDARNSGATFVEETRLSPLGARLVGGAP